MARTDEERWRIQFARLRREQEERIAQERRELAKQLKASTRIRRVRRLVQIPQVRRLDRVPSVRSLDKAPSVRSTIKKRWFWRDYFKDGVRKIKLRLEDNK